MAFAQVKAEIADSEHTMVSPLVRRLVQARHDPAKERIRAWFQAIDNDRLLAFGLTAVDIETLRAQDM